MKRDPCLLPARLGPDQVPKLGEPTFDRYLEFVATRCRPNTVLASASDLRAFARVIDKPVLEVTTQDVFAFIAVQRAPRPERANIIRLSDGESGLSSRTIQRRLSVLSGLFSWLVMIGEAPANPVPRG